MIQVFEIEQKVKQMWATTADAKDFVLRPAGQADPSVVINDPSVTLYCVDPAEGRALFVRTPAGVDLTEEAFFFKAQYDYAEQVLAVPYDLFHTLAAHIPHTSSLVHVHSTGRAGSTLISKAFAEMESTTSLSEPDIYTQVTFMRLGGASDDDLLPLLRSGIAFLFKPSFTCGSTLHVVKHRSFATDIADLIAQVSPDAGNLFLYRDVVPYVRSVCRAFGLLSMPEEVRREVAADLGNGASLLGSEAAERPGLDGVEIGCLIWLSPMHTFVRLYEQGLAILPVRYEELVERPREVLETVLAYLGLPLSGVDAALRAFQRDSQAGSPLARDEVVDPDVQIEPWRWDLVRSLLQKYPLTDVRFPENAVSVP